VEVACKGGWRCSMGTRPKRRRNDKIVKKVTTCSQTRRNRSIVSNTKRSVGRTRFCIGAVV
jgi:hypothetical protein